MMEYVLYVASFKDSFIPIEDKQPTLDHQKLMNSIVRLLYQVLTEKDGIEDDGNQDPVAKAVKTLSLFTHIYDYYKLKGGKYLNEKQAKLKPTLTLKILDLLNAYEIALPINWPHVGDRNAIIMGASYLCSRFLTNKEVDEILLKTTRRLLKEKERA